MQEYLSALEGCLKNLNLPPSVILTTEQHVSSFKRKITGEMDVDRPGHQHTTIPTSTPRTRRSATKNKKTALTYQSLPQLAKQFRKDAGLNHAESEPLSNTVGYQARLLIEERPGIPWKDYTSKEKNCCLKSTQAMIKARTKKTVTRDSLESMISQLIDTRNHAQEEKVKRKKAAAPNSSSAIHSTHFDATDKSHVKFRRFDPIRDI